MDATVVEGRHSGLATVTESEERSGRLVQVGVHLLIGEVTHGTRRGERADPVEGPADLAARQPQRAVVVPGGQLVRGRPERHPLHRAAEAAQHHRGPLARRAPDPQPAVVTLGLVEPLGAAVLRAAALPDCPSGWFCFYDGTNFNYPRGRLSDCGWQDLGRYGWSDRTSSIDNSTGSTIDYENHPGLG
jgi:hypothetical protein